MLPDKLAEIIGQIVRDCKVQNGEVAKALERVGFRLDDPLRLDRPLYEQNLLDLIGDESIMALPSVLGKLKKLEAAIKDYKSLGELADRQDYQLDSKDNQGKQNGEHDYLDEVYGGSLFVSDKPHSLMAKVGWEVIAGKWGSRHVGGNSQNWPKGLRSIINQPRFTPRAQRQTIEALVHLLRYANALSRQNPLESYILKITSTFENGWITTELRSEFRAALRFFVGARSDKRHRTENTQLRYLCKPGGLPSRSRSIATLMLSTLAYSDDDAFRVMEKNDTPPVPRGELVLLCHKDHTLGVETVIAGMNATASEGLYFVLSGASISQRDALITTADCYLINPNSVGPASRIFAGLNQDFDSAWERARPVVVTSEINFEGHRPQPKDYVGGWLNELISFERDQGMGLLLYNKAHPDKVRKGLSVYVESGSEMLWKKYPAWVAHTINNHLDSKNTKSSKSMPPPLDSEIGKWFVQDYLEPNKTRLEWLRAKLIEQPHDERRPLFILDVVPWSAIQQIMDIESRPKFLINSFTGTYHKKLPMDQKIEVLEMQEWTIGEWRRLLMLENYHLLILNAPSLNLEDMDFYSANPESQNPHTGRWLKEPRHWRFNSFAVGMGGNLGRDIESRIFCELYNYTNASLRGKPIYKIIDNEDLANGLRWQIVKFLDNEHLFYNLVMAKGPAARYKAHHELVRSSREKANQHRKRSIYYLDAVLFRIRERRKALLKNTK